jgi:hypothetical protein
MPVTTLTSMEFRRSAQRATKAAGEGPVIITSYGKPTHALLTIEEYKNLTASGDRSPLLR